MAKYISHVGMPGSASSGMNINGNRGGAQPSSGQTPQNLALERQRSILQDQLTELQNKSSQTPKNLALTQQRDALQRTLASLQGSTPPAYDTNTGFLTDYGKSIGAKPVQANDPANTPISNGQQSTGDPAADKALAAVQAQIDTLKNTGYQIPAGLQITPDLVAKFLSIAHQNVDPETQQFLKGAITDINANITNKGNQFLNSQGEIVQNFGISLATEQNAAGGSGTAFSGQRALNEMNMANSTNRTLASLGSNTEADIGNTLRAGAANVGSSNAGGIATPYFNLNTVGIGGGQRGTVNTGRTLNYNYDPSIYTVGAIPSAGITKANALRDSYLSQYGTLAGNQSNSGRSINDLIKGISGLPAGYTP